MELISRTANAAAIIELKGRFDAHSAPSVRAWLEQAFAAGATNIIVNLANVNFVDSTALATLVHGLKRCRELKGDIYLCGLQQPVRIIFELTRLDRAFDIFADEQGALQALGA